MPYAHSFILRKLITTVTAASLDLCNSPDANSSFLSIVCACASITGVFLDLCAMLDANSSILGLGMIVHPSAECLYRICTSFWSHSSCWADPWADPPSQRKTLVLVSRVLRFESPLHCWFGCESVSTNDTTTIDEEESSTRSNLLRKHRLAAGLLGLLGTSAPPPCNATIPHNLTHPRTCLRDTCSNGTTSSVECTCDY